VRVCACVRVCLCVFVCVQGGQKVDMQWSRDVCMCIYVSVYVDLEYILL